jgi:hypothetical protein
VAVADGRHSQRQVRAEVDEPGLHVSLAADVNLVVSAPGSASSTQHVSVRQGRSARTSAEDSTYEEQP